MNPVSALYEMCVCAEIGEKRWWEKQMEMKCMCPCVSEHLLFCSPKMKSK